MKAPSTVDVKDLPLTEEQKQLAGKWHRLATAFVRRLAQKPFGTRLIAMIGWNEAISVSYDGLIRATRKWQPNGGAAFPTYAWRSMQIRFYNAIRAERNRLDTNGDGVLVRLSEEGAALVPDRSQLPDEIAEDRDTETNNRRLLKAMDKLPEKNREVVSLYYFAGMTDLEISKQFNVTKQCVNNWRLAGLRMLRAMPTVRRKVELVA